MRVHTYAWLSTSTKCQPSSENQWQSVGSGEKARWKLSSMGAFLGGRAPGYRFTPDHFQTVKRMLAPYMAQKNALYCYAQSAKSISWVLFLFVCSPHLSGLWKLFFLREGGRGVGKQTISIENEITLTKPLLSYVHCKTKLTLSIQDRIPKQTSLTSLLTLRAIFPDLWAPKAGSPKGLSHLISTKCLSELNLTKVVVMDVAVK